MYQGGNRSGGAVCDGQLALAVGHDCGSAPASAGGTRPVLRDYQVRAVEAIVASEKRRIVLCAPCGSGKTLIAAAIAERERGPVVFLVHRQELVDQSVDKLARFGVQAGVIMADDKRVSVGARVQVASIQTLARRKPLPPAALVIVDEAHHACSASWQRLIGEYAASGARILGLTATPWRTDRRGLADIFEDQYVVSTPAELIESGCLVPTEAFAYDSPDLRTVRKLGGDYNRGQLEEVFNTNVLVGNVVSEYVTHAAGRKAIVFPTTIAHSKHLVSEFVRAGFSAEHLDCDTPREIRRSMVERFGTGSLTILSSVGVLTEGFDSPAAEVCIIARATCSLTLHIQMIGRVMRPSPGKRCALIHDHSGNLVRHGLIDEARDYSLRATPKRITELHTCPFCKFLFGRMKDGHCPKCGELLALVETRGGEGRKGTKIVGGVRISAEKIQAMRGYSTDEQVARAASATWEQKAAEYNRLSAEAKLKGYKPGWVAWQYKRTFGCWPKLGDTSSVTPAEKGFRE